MFNRISFAVVLLAVCIVMAGVIISAGYSNFGNNDPEIYSLSTFALGTGLLISIIIVLGIVISMIKSNKNNKRK